MWDLRPHTKSEHGHYAQHRRHLFNVAQCDMCCGVTYGETEMLGERLLIVGKLVPAGIWFPNSSYFCNYHFEF